MYKIYCAYSGLLNRRSWRVNSQRHAVKIGYHDLNCDRLGTINGGWKTDDILSAPTAMESDWILFPVWDSPLSKGDTQRLEKRIRDWFVKRCGSFLLYATLDREMRAPPFNPNNVNGLTEVLCIDLEKLRGHDPTLGRWRFQETPEIIRRIMAIVRANDEEWRRKTENPRMTRRSKICDIRYRHEEAIQG